MGVSMQYILPFLILGILLWNNTCLTLPCLLCLHQTFPKAQQSVLLADKSEHSYTRNIPAFRSAKAILCCGLPFAEAPIICSFCVVNCFGAFP